MWPTALDMTRDECRGILRRLELETYSNVISTFRAQGGLSEIKVKILEDLRNVFHITQDRHRAEARRAANDEQLCTIAENISGPNTAHEWSREGRRPFPLLPRTPASTAFAAISNGVAESVVNENSKLPYPSETARQAPTKIDTNARENIAKRIVKEEPERAEADRKMKLKRSLSFAEHMALLAPESKKRTISIKSVQTPPQAPVHTNTQIQQLYHSHSKIQSRQKKPAKRTATTPKTKTTSGPGKSQQQKVVRNTVETTVANVKAHTVNQRNLHTYAGSVQTHTVRDDGSKSTVEIEPQITKWPQIATSKKDITNNLSKLNLPSTIQQQQLQQQSQTPVQSPQQQKQQDIEMKLHSDKQPLQIIYTSESLHKDNIIVSADRIADNNSNIISTSDVTQIPWVTKTANVVPSLVEQQQTSNKPWTPHNTKSSTKLTVVPAVSTQNLISPVSESSQVISTASLQSVPQTINLKTRDISDANNFKLISSEVTLPKLEVITNVDVKKTASSIITSNSTPVVLKNQNQGTPSKQKIQITNQQIICPAGGSNIKIPQGVILKGVPGRKSVKIYSSPSGKMFIQSADNSKAIAKIGTVVAQKNILPSSSITTNTIQSPSNRISVQKLQLLPTNTNKQVTLNKSNMVLMQTVGNNMVTTSTGNVIVRNVPLVKNNKTSLQIQESERPIVEVPCTSLVKNQNNVIVIGAISSEKAIKDAKIINKNLNENNMITEDTPVDILTSPITNLDDTLNINQIPKETTIDLKSPNVAVLQSISPVTVSGITKKFQLKKDAIASCVNVSNIRDTKVIQPIVESGSIINTTKDGNYTINTTDWEVELDHEANKIRSQNINSVKYIPRMKKLSGSRCKDFKESEIGAIDNFNDVIEEETMDDDSIVTNDIQTEEEEDVEFDISYDAQEDTEDSTGIEYIEEPSPSFSDDAIELQGKSYKNTSDIKRLKKTTALVTVTSGSQIFGNDNICSSFSTDDQHIHKSQIHTKKSSNYLECTTNGKPPSDVRTLNSSEIMFEMQEIDENGLSHIRSVTFEELLASGQIPSDMAESEITGVTNTKCISE